MRAKPKGATLVVHAPKDEKEAGKLVRGEQFVFGETFCGECEGRLADFMEEVTCLKCLKMLKKESPSSSQIVIVRRE